MAVQKTRNFSHLVIYSCWKYGAFTAVKNNGKFLTYAWNAYHLSWKGIQQGYNFSVKNSMYKRVPVGLDLVTESSGTKVCCIPPPPPTLPAPGTYFKYYSTVFVLILHIRCPSLLWLVACYFSYWYTNKFYNV